ncbi:hypothetical protein CC80DRAFT_580144 [Byssothecium circinans]|uniref:SRR1-like domain-containing protein n=1 Tax=Byssothecium circinans TaxID=147558 RepID=A0A6A5U749_9PLEO|nr:hypothetical protein CC80DRAFT_580144 [Byssothecium circinans]
MSVDTRGKWPETTEEERKYRKDALLKIKMALGEDDEGRIRGPIFTKDRFKTFIEEFEPFIKREKDPLTAALKTMKIPHMDGKPENSVTATLTHRQEKLKIGKDGTRALTNDDNAEEKMMSIRVVQFKNKSGHTATIKLLENDTFNINYRGTLDLTKEEEKVGEPRNKIPDYEENTKLRNMLRQCPLGLRYQSSRSHMYNPEEKISSEDLEKSILRWTAAWKGSGICDIIVKTLKANAETMPRINRVVCFGLGCLNRDSKDGPGMCYVQHLAAATIRDTLQTAQPNDQGHPNVIEVHAQDPEYTPRCKGLLEKINIKTVNATLAEGMTLIDKNTFVMTMTSDPDIFDPVVVLTLPEGPAGLWSYKITGNVEDLSTVIAETKRDELDTSEIVSDRMWNYIQSCKRFPITGSDWFGVAPIKSISGFDANGNPIYRLDENGNVVCKTVDTELYLRKLPESK